MSLEKFCTIFPWRVDSFWAEIYVKSLQCSWNYYYYYYLNTFILVSFEIIRRAWELKSNGPRKCLIPSNFPFLCLIIKNMCTKYPRKAKETFVRKTALLHYIWRIYFSRTGNAWKSVWCDVRNIRKIADCLITLIFLLSHFVVKTILFWFGGFCRQFLEKSTLFEDICFNLFFSNRRYLEICIIWRQKYRKHE